MNSELWPFQAEALENIRASVRSGVKRLVVMAPTGSGKTKLAAAIVDAALRKGNKTAFVVPAISLVDQTLESFYDEGIRDVGVLQASHERTDWSKPVQICSIQTLKARGIWPEAKTVIIDEVHQIHKAHIRWLNDPAWEKVPFIGLSATPWTRGLGKYWQSLLVAETISGLIAKGYLSPFRVFATGHPDLRKVKTVAGDYHEGQLSDAMQQGELTADIVKTWQEKWGKGKTLCFAVDKAHAQSIQARFLETGISCGYQDADTPRSERAEIKRKFHNGEYRVISNIQTMCLDQETEILTQEGWVGISEMNYSHHVAAWAEDGIEFSHPLHIVKRMREPHERMVSLAGRMFNIRVTANHRMLWSKTRHGECEIRPAESLVGKGGFLPVSGSASPKIIEPPEIDHDKERRRRIGLTYKYRSLGMTAEQAIITEKEHRVHLAENCAAKLPHELTLDECNFIGFWIGDGTKSGGRFSVSQSKSNPGIIEWFDKLIKRLDLHCTTAIYPPSRKSKNESIRWNFSTGRGGRSQRVKGGIASLMPYLEKDGADWFWGLNTQQFEALLHGYWLADGNHGHDGKGSSPGRMVAGRSLKLFDLLQAIGSCRGYRITIRIDNGKHRKTPFFWLTWRKQRFTEMLRQRLKFENIYRFERVWCVTSTTGNIITRRRGKVTVVGNTTGVDFDVRCLILARPTRSPSLFVQIIGRGLRIAEGKENLLILDHSDTTQRLGFVTDIHRESLDDGTRATVVEAERKVPLPKECKQCGALKPAGVQICPNCGFKAERISGVTERDGELVEIIPGEHARKKAGKKDWTMDEKLSFFAQLQGYAQERGYKTGWCAMKFKEKFDVFPNDIRYKAMSPIAPSAAVLSWIKSRAIAWAKSKKRQEGGSSDDGLSPRQEAIIAKVREQFVPGTMMTEQDMEDFR